MPELRPYPFGVLVSRMLHEVEARQAIFDLPRRKWFVAEAGRDVSVRFHGQRAATPFGPAAGPQSQLAQNILLSWLAGGRVIELKTVQINDRLTIARPCIDMQTVGYNVEWSQELRLPQSLEEYVKGAMLVRIAAERLGVPAEQAQTIYDMSVGYDLQGIRSPEVSAFIAGMREATAQVDRLRRELDAPYADLDFPTALSRTLTLSTFHGCPPHEIERIIEHLQDTGLHCIVKLNPTLLGPVALRELLHDRLGYEEIRVPDSAFAKDTNWEQAAAFVDRLGARAAARGLGFGVKFSNTLLVENHRSFFPPTEKEMYLSGPPLHVLAMHLVQRLRNHFGDAYPISFSAGIDRGNFADAAALGLVPITVCSDLLQPGGYGRGAGYLAELGRRMTEVGATTLDEWVLRAYGLGDGALGSLGLTPEIVRADPAAYQRWLSAVRLLNTEHYVSTVADDPRYARVQHSKPPKKIGSQLRLFDCISCDKCVPVCPNDANFTFALPETELPILKASRGPDGAFRVTREGTLAITRPHQIGTFGDFCNECGNCDVFCPEDGGPYKIKPRFFGSLESFRENQAFDGFCFDRADGVLRLHGRFEGREVVVERQQPPLLRGPGFSVRLDLSTDPPGVEGQGEQVDLTYYYLLDALDRGVRAEGAVNYVQALSGVPQKR